MPPAKIRRWHIFMMSENNPNCSFENNMGGTMTFGLFPLDGRFLASWICGGRHYNSFRYIVLLYQLFSFTGLLLVKSWSQFWRKYGSNYALQYAIIWPHFILKQLRNIKRCPARCYIGTAYVCSVIIRTGIVPLYSALWPRTLKFIHWQGFRTVIWRTISIW